MKKKTILVTACLLLLLLFTSFRVARDRGAAMKVHDIEWPAVVRARAPQADDAVPAAPRESAHAPSRRHGQTPREDPIPDAMRAVLDDHPDIAQYRWLSQRALPTQDQLEMQREMLSDPDLLHAAKRDLLASSESTLVKESEIRRMFQANFLGDALEWEENPEREMVLQVIEEILLSGSIPVEAPPELRTSIAGDRVEIYVDLLHSAPEEAARLMERASGTEAEQLLAYAKQMYEQDTLGSKLAENND